MNKILWIILFLLMILVDKNRGFKLFISILINFAILMIIFYFIMLGLNPIILSIIGCLLMSLVILYFVNGKNEKTTSSMKSILIVFLLLITIVVSITHLSRIAGFGEEAYEEINMFSYDVGLDFTNITSAVILIGLIGVITDASIAISTAQYEVYDNNKHLPEKELFTSGMNVGKDILCTSVNTLLFAFLGDFMTLMIWFYECQYSFLEIINSKTFALEFIKILFSGIGCLLIIPITAFITAKQIKHRNS